MREDAVPESFGEILRRYRWVAGLTQEELARESGLSSRAVSDIERGHTGRPYARTIRMLADALKLDEDARARLMSAVLDCTDEAAGERQDWTARWPETAAESAEAAAEVTETEPVPAAQAPRDNHSWQQSRRARWTQLAAAGVAAVLVGGTVGWAAVDHAQATPSAVPRLQLSGLPPQVAIGPSPAAAHCYVGTVDLASSLLYSSNRAFWGTLEVRYSYRCAAAWTTFDPSPAVSETKAVVVTLKIIRRPDGKYQVSRSSGTDDGQSTNALSLLNGCAQGSVILIKLGRELASTTTPCQAPP